MYEKFSFNKPHQALLLITIVFIPVARATVWAAASGWRSGVKPTNQMKEKLADVTVKVSDRFSLTASQELGLIQGHKQAKCPSLYCLCCFEHRWPVVCGLEEFGGVVWRVSHGGLRLKEPAVKGRMVSSLRWVMLWMLALHILALPFTLIYSPDLEASRGFTNYIISCVSYKCIKYTVVNSVFGIYCSRASPADWLFVWIQRLFIYKWYLLLKSVVRLC